MQQIEKRNGKIKAWGNARYFVLHNLAGQKSGLIATCEPEIELLLNRKNFPITGEPWVPVVHGDTLHLIHPDYTACEGEA